MRPNSSGTKIMANLPFKSKLTILSRRRRNKKNLRRSRSLARKRKKKRRIKPTGQEAAEVVVAVADVAAITTATIREELALPAVVLASSRIWAPSPSSKAKMTITTSHHPAPPRLRRLRHKSKRRWN